MSDKPQIFSVRNPEVNAPIDTIVEGTRYEIAGGAKIENVPETHAQYLKETYGFLDVQGLSGDQLPNSKDVSEAAATGQDPKDVAEANVGGDDADPKPAKAGKGKAAAKKKTAAKKTAARKRK